MNILLVVSRHDVVEQLENVSHGEKKLQGTEKAMKKTNTHLNCP
jgi:hypothetical protein